MEHYYVDKNLYLNKKLLWLCLALFTGSHAMLAQANTKLSVTHKILPAPVKIDRVVALFYELYFNNHSDDSIHLTGINVMEKSVLVADYEEHDLVERFVNRSRRKTSKPILAPGDSAVVYIEMSLRTLPAILNHAIRFNSSRLGAQVLKGPSINCSQAIVPILGPPVGRGNWAAVWDPSWQRGHRRVLFQVQGKERIPGRFAIDFIRLEDQGKYSDGDEDVVSNWLGYGSEILAVADGTVASVQTDFTESSTLSQHPSYPAEKATGNYISIDIGNGQYAFYEHLKPESIRVRVGQKVKKGDVIASLGFTGQSTGPHLHFHVADTDSPLGAEGIPFVFEHFEFLGSYPDFSRFGKEKWAPADLEKNKITNERPAPNTVIRF